jgi:hypothetical protein
MLQEVELLLESEQPSHSMRYDTLFPYQNQTELQYLLPYYQQKEYLEEYQTALHERKHHCHNL